MARTYQLTSGQRLVNSFISVLVRLGVNLRGTYLLSVEERKSGKIYTTPVTLVEQGEQRWLVAPYGEVNWVRNARAAGRVTLDRGRHSETVIIVELSPQESAPVLKEYLKRVPTVRPYFDATPVSPLEVFVTEAARHPVFRIVGPATSYADRLLMNSCPGLERRSSIAREGSIDEENSTTLTRNKEPCPDVAGEPAVSARCSLP